MHVYNVILQLLVEQLCGAVVPQEKQNVIWKQQFTTFEAFVLQYSQKKIMCYSLFLMLHHHSCFPVNIAKFLRTIFFYRAPAVAAFEY